MIYLLIISAVLFFAYTMTATIDWYLTMQGAMPSSLSSTYYLLENHQKGMGNIFTFAMILCAFTIIAPWVEATPDACMFIPFIGTAGIGFVGAAPYFRDGSLAYDVHVGGAVIAAFAAALWGIFVAGAWLIWLMTAIAVAFAAAVTGSVRESRTYWLEMIAFISTYLTLFSLYL